MVSEKEEVEFWMLIKRGQNGRTLHTNLYLLKHITEIVKSFEVFIMTNTRTINTAQINRARTKVISLLYYESSIPMFRNTYV